MAAPVERKVTASSYTAAASGLVLWVLGTYVFKGDVPDVIVSWTYVLVPGLLTFAAGYAAKHTFRIDEKAAKQLPADIPQAGRGTYVQPEVGLPPGFVPPSAALPSSNVVVTPETPPTP
jgi:hypothetical protein